MTSVHKPLNGGAAGRNGTLEAPSTMFDGRDGHVIAAPGVLPPELEVIVSEGLERPRQQGVPAGSLADFRGLVFTMSSFVHPPAF